MSTLPPYRAIASRLSSRLRDDPSFAPGSVTALARAYGVSYPTMLRAVKILTDQGLLTRRKGTGVFRAGKAQSPISGKLPTGSARRLYEKLKADILDGVCRIGVALPKYDYLIRTERVASTTLNKALSALARENLVHKEGKRWYAGAGKPKTGGGIAVQTPTHHVMVLVNNELSAFGLFNNSFFSPFVQNFNTELQHHGVQITLVHYLPPESTTPLIPWGLDEARRRVASFGDRYMGALIFDVFPSLTVYRPWAQVLSCAGTKPLVYYDYADRGPEITAAALKITGEFYRMVTDEERAVEMAVGYLHDAGHRVVGAPVIDKHGYDWTYRRRDITCAVAQRMTPPVRIVPATNTEPFWNLGVDDSTEIFLTFHDLVRQYCVDQSKPDPSQQPRSIAREILRNTRSMTTLLRENITALIAPNDRLAHAYYLWCTDAGIEVPRHLSIIGFDNVPESVSFPLAAVDFGFARLGYLAAHILLGDTTVRADREGIIKGIPLLIDRGSVAPPRQGKLAVL